MIARRLLLGARAGGHLVGPLFVGLFNGQSGTGNYQIGQVSSSDSGQTWTPYASNPVIGPAVGQVHVKDPWIVWDGSQYVAFAASYDSATYLAGTYRIRRYTSADGLTWVDHGVVIDSGSSGDPDFGGCSFPTIVFNNSDTPKWRCWYRGWADHTTEVNTTICYAESSDGITWTKKGKVIDVGTGSDFDATGIEPGSVFYSGGTWYVYYAGYNAGGTGFFRSGYATCTAPTGAYTKQGKIAALDTTVTIAGRTWRSNIPRGAIVSLGNGSYRAFVGYWNPSDSSGYESGGIVTLTSLTSWTVPTTQFLAVPGSGWDSVSAENLCMLPKP